ncbi:MAG: hypothetical protein JWM27_1259 [Gemmatimonadetes bacterium]|nr:hypothetical protein [Gemmatimonadota bacterium]
MIRLLAELERIARNAHRFTDLQPSLGAEHPFDLREIHPTLPNDVKRLFDNGHYAQATFEAFKYLDRAVKRIAKLDKSGKALMMEAFREIDPPIHRTSLATETERVEQEGYKFMFAGSMMAIRNPRGHEHSVEDDLTTCLDHLTLVSLLLRRLDSAGCKIV